MRRIVGGFYDQSQKHGAPVGNGVAFDEAMAKFNRRQARLSKNGKWRKSPAKWKKDDGSFIDPEYYIVDWGQDG